MLFSEKYSNPHIACCIFSYPLENAKRREIRQHPLQSMRKREASVFKNLISEAPRLKTCPFLVPKNAVYVWTEGYNYAKKNIPFSKISEYVWTGPSINSRSQPPMRVTGSSESVLCLYLYLMTSEVQFL